MNGLEQDLAGRASVLQLDLLSGVGKEAAGIYGVKVVPTVLVFDGRGELVFRQTGKVNADPIREQIAALEAE